MQNNKIVNVKLDFELSEREFNRLRENARIYAGISIGKDKRELIYGRIVRRLRALKLESFSEYCRYLDENQALEVQHFVNAVTTNLTSFFRESHHFDFMQQTLIPEVASRMRDRKSLRIWSAGCSTGEEPYSIAITLAENIPDIHNWDLEILATDIDTNVLSHAQEGVYKLQDVEGMGYSRCRKWFLKGVGGRDAFVKVNPVIKSMVKFNRLNLMDNWPMQQQFDLIICRNVLIYFDKPSQGILFGKFESRLKPGGYLIIGHSENVHSVNSHFVTAGRTIYRLEAP